MMSKNYIAIGLLHGLGGGFGDFEKLKTQLTQQGYQVFKIKIPGHYSPETLKNISIPRLIENTKKKLIGYKKLVLVGHSFGGNLAMNMASILKPLGIVIFSAPYYYDRYAQIISKIFASLPIKIPASKPEKIILSQNFTYYKKHPYYYFKTFSWFMDFVAYTKDKIKNISCPTLIMCGKKDNIVPYSHSEKIFADLISQDKELCILPNSGHMIMHDLDNKKAFNKILQFLNNIRSLHRA